MYEQMKNLKQMMGALGNPQELREKFEQIQEELAQKTVEAESGAGAVRVTVNGRFEVKNVTLDPHMIAALAGEGSDADRDMVEELIASATNAALEKAQQMVRDEMSRLTGGLNMPGLENMFGGGA
ncbi:MAG: YbaB/EbfC family nucleoid-associated protein [Phycisphaeraceae bacterium]